MADRLDLDEDAIVLDPDYDEHRRRARRRLSPTDG